MSDLISRQAAIDAVSRGCQEFRGIFAECEKNLNELPSAQPERPRGEWINRSLNIIYPDWERYTCSACGKHAYNYDFCPNCGADMRGEQDEID